MDIRGEYDACECLDDYLSMAKSVAEISDNAKIIINQPT